MISVIIPLYNKEKSIAQTLDSVLGQKCADFEVVIVNDGSTDNSYSIAKEYVAKDNRIHLFKQSNGGPSKARNTGVKQAKGEWILFLDADDELLPGALATFEKYAQSWPEADMLLMEVMVTDGKLSHLARKYKNGLIKYPFLAYCLDMLFQCSGSTIYRKSVCEHVPFNEHYRRYEDLDRLFKLYRSYRLYSIGEPCGKIHIDYSAASHARKDISDDFVGHIDLHGKGFWERISLYGLYLGERDYYPEQCYKLYPHFYHRYDLLLIYKVLKWLGGNRFAMPLLYRLVYSH